MHNVCFVYVISTYDYCYITFYVDKKNKMTRQIFGNESFLTVTYTVTHTYQQIQKFKKKKLYACILKKNGGKTMKDQEKR